MLQRWLAEREWEPSCLLRRQVRFNVRILDFIVVAARKPWHLVPRASQVAFFAPAAPLILCVHPRESVCAAQSAVADAPCDLATLDRALPGGGQWFPLAPEYPAPPMRFSYRRHPRNWHAPAELSWEVCRVSRPRLAWWHPHPVAAPQPGSEPFPYRHNYPLASAPWLDRLPSTLCAS